MINDGIHCLLILSLIVGDLVFSSKSWKAMKAVYSYWIQKIADSYLPLIHSDRGIVNGESSTLMPHLFCYLKM